MADTTSRIRYNLRMPIRAVFFDLDDTLLDTSRSNFARAELAAARLVEDYPELIAAELCECILAPHPEAHLGPLWPVWPSGVGHVLEELGLHETPGGLAAQGIWFFSGSEHLLTPTEGVVEAIRALNSQITVGVITNGPDDIQRHKFRHLGLEDRVSVFMASERVGVAKPDPRIFQLAMQEAGVQPHESVFVGDILDIDITGALAAGMHAIWYNPARAQTQSQPAPSYYDLGSYRELAAILEKLQTL
jgi:putative hydrolase of the HAD superfamily